MYVSTEERGRAQSPYELHMVCMRYSLPLPGTGTSHATCNGFTPLLTIDPW